LERKLKVIVLSHGRAENLLQQLTVIEEITVVGVFIETEVNRRSYTLREKLQRSIRYDGYPATAAKLWRQLAQRGSGAHTDAEISSQQEHLRQFAEQLGLPVYTVANYHAAESLVMMRETAADLGLISGTNILKPSVFGIPRLGSINLHQGLAPYYRGGPPVFWELFNGESEIGLTIHFVAEKVDTGDIIAQQRVPLVYDYAYGLDYDSFIADYRARLAEPCARLMAEATRAIALNKAQRMPQDISLGARYRLPVKREKDELRRRLRERQRQAQRVMSKAAGGTGE
jgi:folate-dependent phosphoribosylglycinamide formyltransferase PurN